MSKHSGCLGCRTFFQENQTLSLECMTIQYKNFNIPLVQNKHKWNVLKTIVSFLNSKGGTIYIGVQDTNCKVVGKQLSSKARDEFKLYLLTMIERIVPQIDLNIKQELSVQYVPIVKNKMFSGKYLTKIIVQQGDPSQTYCFSQKVQMAPQGKKEIQNQCESIEIVHSYLRHNMGGARELKGMKLVQQAIKKAQNPSPKFNTFHEECNPQPPELEVQIKKIGFKNLGNRQARRKFERIFKQNLQKLSAQFQIAYDTQFKAVVIQLPTSQQFKRINNFIKSNLSSLNESQNNGVRFVEAGDYLDIHFYENTNKDEEETNSSPKKASKQKQVREASKSRQKQLLKNENQKQTSQPKKFYRQIKQESAQLTQVYALTFTHINPSIKNNLINYLTVSISKKIHVNCQDYVNTVEVFMNSQEDLQKYAKNCFQNNHLIALQNFGFHKEIRIGINTKHLHILNYDKSKQNKLINFLKNLMSKDMRQIGVLKNGNRYIIDCKMATRNLSCEWLDKLLSSNSLKQYRIPGAQNGQKPKMKIFIHTEQIKQ